MPDEMYSMVEEAWKLAIESQDCQQALPGAAVSTPSVYQLPDGPSLKIDPQTRKLYRYILLSPPQVEL